MISMLADALKHGTFNRGFTLYVLPLRGELGIGLAFISFADMLGRLEGGLLGPISGYLTDRFGPRLMMAFGGLTSGLGFILLASTHSYLSFVLVFVGLISVGMRSGYNNASVPALNQWFRRRRALAMSVASVGNGLGGFLIAPVVGLLVVSTGWREAAVVSGVAIIVVVIPLSMLVRRSPETMGLRPDGDSLDVPLPGRHGSDRRQAPLFRVLHRSGDGRGQTRPIQTLRPGRPCAVCPTGCWSGRLGSGIRSTPGCLSCWLR